MMNYRHIRSRKGVIGIESAIVLIAFVVVAAALAFVVLNMGIFASQRSKESIGAGLRQASSSLELAGTVLAEVNTTTQEVTCMVIPIRLSAGQKEVDLTPGKASISVAIIGRLGSASIYNESSQAIKTATSYEITSMCNLVRSTAGAVKSDTGFGAAVIWDQPNNNDNLLDAGEKAYLVVVFTGATKPVEYDTVKVEIRVDVGATLTVDRTIPPSLTKSLISLD